MSILESPERNLIVFGGYQVATVWDMNALNHDGPNPPRAFGRAQHSDWVCPVDISPKATRFATGTNDGTANIWNIPDGTGVTGHVRLLPQHDGLVLGVKFSPDGNCLATGDSRALRIYDTNSTALLRTFLMPITSWPSTPILWPTAQSIFALSGNTVNHIDRVAGWFLASWTVPGVPVDHFGTISLAGNGRFIACTAGTSISLWDTSTSTRISFPIQLPSQVWSIAISPDYKYLASSHAGTITLHNLNSIVPDVYRVGDRLPPEVPSGGANLAGQIQTLHEARCKCTITQTNDNPQPAHTTPRIPDGQYRIRSNTDDLYLTCPGNGVGTVVVQPLNRSSASQKWTVSLVADGIYNVTGNPSAPLSVGVRNSLVTGRKGTTWTFDARGNAYTIGNAVNATAIQLAPNRRSVSQIIFNKLDLCI
ncbi:hypothetical protein EV363DRAFT_1168834 [Boletus edulis]|nr:hypothetical protein EV363DRAFT_1168834 [Boletus edulis]